MNNNVMIDSSCWIKYFRNDIPKIADSVQKLIEEDRACICGIIELEIIQGIKNEQQSKIIKDLFSIIPYYNFDREDFISAGNRIKNLITKEITFAISDSLIAEICIRNQIELFTLDNDFRFSKIYYYLNSRILNIKLRILIFFIPSLNIGMSEKRITILIYVERYYNYYDYSEKVNGTSNGFFKISGCNSSVFT